MNPQAAQSAIKAALNAKWDEAIEFNLQILKDNPEDIQALNRMGRAFAAIGQTRNAKKTWNKVIKLDRYNSIAATQLEKLKSKSNSNTNQSTYSNNTTNQPNIFLDEPGKTITTQLVRLAGHQTIANLEPGMKVALNTNKRSIAVTAEDNLYLGSLPDDLSIHLKQLIKSGNQYAALIRRVEKNNLYVFIKETKRSKKNLNTPSFIVKKHTRKINLDNPAPINQTPIDITPTGEEAEN